MHTAPDCAGPAPEFGGELKAASPFSPGTDLGDLQADQGVCSKEQ